MNRIIYSIVLLSTAASAYSQDLPEKYAALQQRIRQINQDKTLQKITSTGEEVTDHTTDGGAELVGYYKNGNLKKITRTIGLSNGIESFDYYFENEKLVFICELFNGFVPDSTGALNFEKTETNFIGRYYFRDDKLIDNQTTGHNRFEDDTVDMEGSLLAEVRDSIVRLKKAQEKRNKEHSSVSPRIRQLFS
jgi:hypothetical protein